MGIQRITDYDVLAELLTSDRLANAYLLGNLDPAYMPFCKWYADDDLTFLALEYIGLSLPVVFFTGTSDDTAMVEKMMGLVKSALPARFHFHVPAEYYDVFCSVFSPKSAQGMLRMGLEKSAYHPIPSDVSVDQLGHRDTAAIMDLYQHYPDNLFEPYQVETGLYFAVRDEELGLSSIAGIHVKSGDYDIAVIGNFVTHPDRRGQKLGSACTARLLDELFTDCSLVALNVQDENDAAIAMFEKFGFTQNNVFYEGRVE